MQSASRLIPAARFCSQVARVPGALARPLAIYAHKSHKSRRKALETQQTLSLRKESANRARRSVKHEEGRPSRPPRWPRIAEFLLSLYFQPFTGALAARRNLFLLIAQVAA